MKQTSISSRRTHNSCKLKWYYSASEGMDLIPLYGKPVQALDLGSVIHKAFAEWLNGEINHIFERCLELALTEYQHSDISYKINDMKETFTDLENYINNLLRTHEIIETEREIELVLNNPLTGENFKFVFIPDLILWSRGKFSVLDLKTTGRIPTNTAHLEIDDQAIGYPALIELSDLAMKDIEEFTFLFVSTAKSNPLKEQVVEHTVYPNAKAKAQWLSDLYNHVAEMYSLDTQPYPSPNRFCGSCPFYMPCSNRGDLKQHQKLVEANYFTRKEAYEQYELTNPSIELLPAKKKREIVHNYKEYLLNGKQ